MIIDREKILNNAKKESELSDLKQHADKMIRGFENFNSFSSNRAVWELVQNACDLTSDCEVVIDYRSGFSFTHNGKPFTTKSFISLIKQVSGKYGEESELPEVGKYGTGFLTTHTFGRKFLINSILDANGTFFEISDFLIDRSPKEWRPLCENIRTQKESVYQLISMGRILTDPEIKTTFTFLPETDQEREYIAESGRDLEDYIPIVLTINDRLRKVRVITGDSETSFERTEKEKVENDKGIELYKTTVSKNGDTKILYSLIEEESQIEVILPINQNLETFQFSDRVARLFLYYPLIGSEDFGINFVINCNQFLPTEPRDGVHLKSNRDQVKEQEEDNRKILEKASGMIFDFLKSNVLNVSDPLLFARINFRRDSENALLNTYFENLQSTWVEEFKSLPLVQTSGGFKAVREVGFFADELLSKPEYFDAIHTLVSGFYTEIPLKEKISMWSRFAMEWGDTATTFIGHGDLVKKIAGGQLFSFDKDCLADYYRCLIEDDKVHFFSEYPLLPNLDGKFGLVSLLLVPENLTRELIETGKALVPDYMDRLVHPDFVFGFHFGKFNRKDFSNSVKAKLDEIQAAVKVCFPENLSKTDYDLPSVENAAKLEVDLFVNLLKYCRLNSNVNSQSKPVSLVKIISRYYSLNENLIQLGSLDSQDENLDIRSARKILVQIFFNLLRCHNQGWVRSNIYLLHEIASCNEDSLKEVFAASNVYPNQLFQLRSVNDLKRDLNILPDIKKLYDRVTGDEIGKELVFEGFNEFVSEDRFLSNKDLSRRIEDVFFSTDIHNINEHPFKDEILKIISSLRDRRYADLFQRLDDRKANLMLEVVTNENTKDEIFSIVTLKESELKKLGKLVREDNFEAILNAAADILELQKKNQADFHHKHEIGTYIENLIRQKISAELQNRVSFGPLDPVETSNVQGGQDIVVFLDGIPVYFIEVKSRWNSQNSVSMSKLQLQRAVEHNMSYALCVVDITRYSGSGDRYRLSTGEILPLTKFVTQIGKSIQPLIQMNLEAEKEQDKSVHLVDYRGIIPQDIVLSGNDFESFIEKLADTIKALEID